MSPLSIQHQCGDSVRRGHEKKKGNPRGCCSGHLSQDHLCGELIPQHGVPEACHVNMQQTRFIAHPGDQLHIFQCLIQLGHFFCYLYIYFTLHMKFCDVIGKDLAHWNLSYTHTRLQVCTSLGIFLLCLSHFFLFLSSPIDTRSPLNTQAKLITVATFLI